VKIQSPCIGVCSTGIGDTVCRGCKRYLHEISSWLAYSDEERLSVIRRISSLTRQVSEPVLTITSVERLKAALIKHQVRFDENADPYVWVLELLKMGASSLPNLDDFGCVLNPSYTEYSLVEIREQIDRDFFALSVAHHERYFGTSE
jgi:predicted Fe-S protein YdhL (DUF1289 family)